ncbi:MAG: threonylcarbamoyl-AMP synthase [Deltaproteobacteria bacterium]|nr:threonylcarbamoyl-AMP synthase [Deltaproteobacteria bacterium]
MLLSINPKHPEPRKIQRVVEVLEKGGLIAYPTDTVYGLGCDPLNKQAIDRLYQLKGMPRTKPLALICKDLSDLATYAIVENPEYRLLKRFLPGPYCFILDATREVPKMLTTKQKTVGIRVPDHPVPRAIVEALGRPLVSTTAGRDDEPLIDPWTIEETFPGLEVVLEADVCGSVPTTVVDLSGGNVRVVRDGAGPVDELV